MNFLKKYFIPHKINGYKPHIMREFSVAIIFLLVIALFVIAISNRVLVGRDFTALVLPKVLVDYTNTDRDLKNYGHLIVNPILEKAAQLKANDMAENSYFAHKSPDGKTPWYWFKQVGYDFSYAGENLAVNFNDSVDVNTAWMNSPGHKANIMNENFTEIGIATADGMYQGRKTTFVVQLFGRPAESMPTQKIINTQTVKKVESKTLTPATTSGTMVLSESVTKSPIGFGDSNELFIEVQKLDTPTTSASEKKYSNFFERAVLSPERTLSIVYLLIAIIVSIGLIFTAFVEFRSHNIRMMLLSIGVLIVIFGLLYIYKSIVVLPLLIA